MTILSSNITQTLLGLSVAALAFGSACAVDATSTFDTEPGDPKGQGVGGKAEEWSSSDDPHTFAADITVKYSALPKSGAAANIPWAANYWPTYEDDINHRWDGADSKSAAEKFGLAFDVSGVEDAVSKHHGIDSQDHRTACTEDSTCDSDKGEACAKRRGENSGYCIPTWFGICHAWAPAALMRKEPEQAVTYGGQEFKVNDIKALLTLAHNSVDSKFVSLRCNSNPDDIEFDDDGRPTSNSCRYTNAATYHLLLSNFLGLRKQGFVEDRTFSSEVWNQPIRSFKVDEERTVTVAEANTLIGVQPDNLVSHSESGTVEKAKWSHFGPYTVGAGDSINVDMTGNGDSDLYVRLGSQPVEATGGYDCRPYSNNSVESCNLVASASTTEFYVSVVGYADTSDFEIDIKSGSVPSTYKFNSKAETLQYVKTTVSWITEAPATVDGNLASRIDDYTRTDTYEYILEIDGSGDLIGGEWVGNSKKTHPDFVWLPTGLSASTTVAGGKISWADVKKIYDLSIGETEPPVVTTGDYTWNGNGSLISFTSDTDTGYGLNYDMSRVHPGNDSNAVFFQWEIDGRDGRRLEIKGTGTASVRYGSWGNRDSDRVYENVTLPFVLDPAKDSKNTADGQYYVVQVTFDTDPGAKADVRATATSAAASSATSTAATAVTIDGHTWNGNASVISHSSGSRTGYGLNYDIANIHPTSAQNPVVFFQWEVSAADGTTLELSAAGMTSATITYGAWDNRDSDVTKTVSLPYVLNPAADGKTVSDGTWYVIKVAFDAKPATKTAVWAKTTNANP